jgi:hypothetical protein
MKIPYARFDFLMEAEEEIHLPSYKGSTFRGAFGSQFKKVACALRQEDCHRCLLRQRCVYAIIFESPSPPEGNVLGQVNSIPHPFVIEPPIEEQQRYHKGQLFSIGLILIGNAIQYLPYFIYTFDLLGKNGIGKGRGSCLLREVATLGTAGIPHIIYRSKTGKLESYSKECIDLSQPVLSVIKGKGITSPPATDAKREIAVTFLTPTRLKYNGKLTTDLEFHVFIRQLLRRLFLLTHYYCKDSAAGDSISGEGYHRTLIDMASAIRVTSSNLRWYDWERYSRRQDTRMKLGGFVGEIVYTGDLSLFIPFLKAGEILHVGKGTSFGLGKYTIRP